MSSLSLMVRLGGGASRRASAWRRIQLAGVLVAAGVAGGLLLWTAGRTPLPMPAVEQARRALFQAEVECGDGAACAEAELARARELARQMERTLARSRGDLWPARHGELLTATALDAEVAARAALSATRRARLRLFADASRVAPALEARVDAGRRALPTFAGDWTLRSEVRRAELALARGRDRLAAGSADEARSAFADAERALGALEARLAQRRLRLSDPLWRRTWQRWTDETVAASRRVGVAVLVDKAGGRCLLLENGRPVAVFAAEIGRGGLAPKSHAGDAATPEGRYRVVEKRDRGDTRYHRALLLDYPNAEDRARFAAARRAGRVPAGRGIGGLIEIHGEGGRGLNWTDGCVALDNADMERLFSQVGVGTPVTIVGQAARWPEIRAEAR